MASQIIKKAKVKRRRSMLETAHMGHAILMAAAKNNQILNKLPKSINPVDVLTFISSNKIDHHYIGAIKEVTNFPDETLSDLFDVSVKTYRGYKTTRTLLGTHLQEQTIMLLTLMKHGIEVFGTSEKFTEWLEKENFFFDKKKPISFLKSINGIKLVDDSLTGMEYGDNA